MPIPEFVVELRRHVGHDPLWLVGATAVVLRGEGPAEEVLLVRRADTDEWSPVTGIVEPGQETHDTAVREVLEEASVVAEVEALVWVSTTEPVTHVNGDQAQYVDHTFRLRWVSGEPAVGDDENHEARWWPTAALPPMRPHFGDRVAVALSDPDVVLLGNPPVRPGR
ncbi:NUDIX hydrolase [Arsenicicoccus dermatophilus]|uniref:NUDIX hydrolase n=1 Tax=Arsenicicoccus dermatophilus TaxID=1076331 RepID=UPI0039174BE3